MTYPFQASFHIIDQAKVFKGTVVNRALLSLHGSSLEITLTVTLKQLIIQIYTPVANRNTNKYAKLAAKCIEEIEIKKFAIRFIIR